MTQEMWLEIITVIYFLTSWTGAILFSFVWRLTRRDRLNLGNNGTSSRREVRLRRVAALRNESVAGVMGLAFWIFSLVSVISLIRQFHIIDLPWIRGLVTVWLLVLGNFLMMSIAVVKLWARREYARAGDIEEKM